MVKKVIELRNIYRTMVQQKVVNIKNKIEYEEEIESNRVSSGLKYSKKTNTPT